MPAAEPLPTVQQLVNAYQGALVSQRRHGDTREGSVHDHWNGLGALLWRRQVERDQQEFQALYFNSAKGTRLDAYIERRFPGKSRVTDARGTGTVKLRRPSAAAGAGTFLEKTRIAVGDSGANPIRYYLTKGTPTCGATDLVRTVDIEADRPGPDSQLHIMAGDRPILRLEDPLWDNTWTVEELACSAGTLREEDNVVVPRIRAELIEERFGYESAIIKAMKAAGAATVVLFRSDYLGEENDQGLNRIYVGDANFETTAELLLACRLAAPSVVIAGAANQVLAMTTSYLTLGVTVRFWASPDKFSTEAAQQAARAAVVEYFETRENPFVWDFMGIIGAVRRAVEDTQSIEITASAAPPTLATVFNTAPLPRFRTTPNLVTVTLGPPSA